MNSKIIAATVVALAGFSSVGAFAQNRLEGEAANAVRFDTATSNVTRAQVNTDYLQARQNGALPVTGEANFAPAQSGPSSVSRAEVYADASKSLVLDGSGRRTQRQ